MLDVSFNNLDDDYDKQYDETMSEYIERILDLQNNPQERNIPVNNI